MEDTKNLPNTYSIGDVNFTLQSIHDVSEQQNGDVILGVYKVRFTKMKYIMEYQNLFVRVMCDYINQMVL